ncbi:sugar kinase [soil metagenome]
MADLGPDAPRLVVVGDLMADVVVAPLGPLRPGSDTAATITSAGGGSAANTAAWLAWAGRSTSLVAARGDDPLGRAVGEDLAAHGVELLGPVIPGARTGCCVVLVDADGERTMLPDRGANDALTPDHVGTLLDEVGLPLGRVGWVHLSGYLLLHPGSRAAGQDVVRRTRAAGVGLSVDAASAGPLRDLGADTFLGLIGGTELLMANAEELAALGGEEAVLGSVRGLVTKRGADGASWSDGHEQVDVLATPADVVDTTGAGDAFAAGFLASWVAGERVTDALAAGAARAADAVAHPGGRPPASRIHR